ncbi:class C sortase [Bifidobacterium aemilianum]|nr:class C sortase [Bifidobacterium aemilianum]
MSRLLTADFTTVVTDDTPDSRRIRDRRVDLVLRLAILICILVAVSSILWIPAVQYVNARKTAVEAEAAAARVAKWPNKKTKEELTKVNAYNRKLADSGQGSMGEAIDPFSPEGSKGKSVSQKDTDYRSLLDVGGGIMGIVRIPKVSVKLPVFHGTSDESLARGAGHLYGTSLPVGGKSTNAVLSGHRGLPDSLLFTRLDELKVGDVFYLDSLGRTMGYRITAINVIDPEDTHLYKVVPGQDLVTLMTCTPYGVNTQRLVLTGTRESMPHPIPYPDQSDGDGVLQGLKLGLLLLSVGMVAVTVTRKRSLFPCHFNGMVADPNKGKLPYDRNRKVESANKGIAEPGPSHQKTGLPQATGGVPVGSAFLDSEQSYDAGALEETHATAQDQAGD